MNDGFLIHYYCRLDTFKGAPIRKTFSNAAFLTKYKTDEERSVMSEDLL